MLLKRGVGGVEGVERVVRERGKEREVDLDVGEREKEGEVDEVSSQESFPLSERALASEDK